MQRRVQERIAIVLVVTALLCISGCGTLSNGRGWGQDAFAQLDGQRVARAAYNALMDVQTLLPALGAIVFTIDDFDGKVSSWAMENHPVFGSNDTAKDFSDVGLYALYGETTITALATPSGEDSKQWVADKAKGVTVEATAFGITVGITEGLKEATNRTRPNNGDASFPSGHTSKAFACSTLSNRNLGSIPMPNAAQTSIQVTNLFLAAGVGWARVESGYHYPSDVLAGAALGHFIAAFVHDAFLGLPEENRFGLVIFPMKNGGAAQVFHSF
jgi:membrane-associated phospholipid phosphatase